MPKNLNHSFTFIPTQTDVDAYLKFKSGEQKSRTYMKDYKSLHHIKDLSDTSILVYEAIRNLVGLYVLQQNAISKYKDAYKDTKDNKINKNTKANKNKGIGTTRDSSSNANPYTVVGTTLTITNPMLQEWIGDKSHNTIKSALAQLESMGFIKCVDATGKKSGRKITLLRDMEDYQPEEIFAIESYIENMNVNECRNESESMDENVDENVSMGKRMSESDMDNDVNVNDSMNADKNKNKNTKINKNKSKSKNNSKSAINKNVDGLSEDSINLSGEDSIGLSKDSINLSEDSTNQFKDDSSQIQKSEDKDTTLKRKSLKSLSDAVVSGLGNSGKVNKTGKVGKTDDEIDEVDEFEGFDF